MKHNNITRSMFKPVKEGYVPRVGDYYCWPCDKFQEDNTCYQPSLCIKIDKSYFYADITGTVNNSTNTIKYLLWYRPKPKITIVVSHV